MIKDFYLLGSGPLARNAGGISAPHHNNNGEPTYIVSGFSDTNYFSGSAGQGRGTLGTVRFVGTMLSIPTNATKMVAQRCDNSGVTRGWYIGTGVGGAAGCIMLVAAGCAGRISPAFQFSPTDLNQLFVLHGTIDSSFVRLFINGVEIGSGTATGVSCTSALSTEFMTVGRHRSAGLSNSHIGIAALHASPTVMDSVAIAADAAAIMSRTSRLIFPTLPDEDIAYIVSDLVSSTDWRDRDGDNATLIRMGSVTLTEVT
jgi:hypothetical protein